MKQEGEPMRYLVVFDIVETSSSQMVRPASEYSIGAVVRGIDIPKDASADRAAKIVQACIAEETRRFSASSMKTVHRDLIYRHLERIE
jgi:hypothetical protein